MLAFVGSVGSSSGPAPSVADATECTIFMPDRETIARERSRRECILSRRTNFILGQTHFIKSVEDIHEALVGAVPGIEFELAFCEASGKCLVRCSGTDPAMVQLAQKNASAPAPGIVSSCSLAKARFRQERRAIGGMLLAAYTEPARIVGRAVQRSLQASV